MQPRIILLLVAACLCWIGPSPAPASLPGAGQQADELLGAEVICEGHVYQAQSQWVQDHRGRHIYTRVGVAVRRSLRGRLPDPVMELEVQGGTVGRITETVSEVPLFVPGEQVVLFLAGRPPRLVGGSMGKLPVRNGMVLWRGRRIPLTELIERLEGAQDPDQQGGYEPSQDRQAGPTITALIPQIGAAGTGVEVNVIGVGLDEPGTDISVEFFYRHGRSRISGAILSRSGTSIVCQVPVDLIDGYLASASSGPVSVVIDGRRSNELPFRVTFGRHGSRWAADQVQYLVNENCPDCEDEGLAVQAAAQTWNLTGSSLEFLYEGPHSSQIASYNGHNELMWGRTGTGVAATWSWDLDGVVLECDTVFSTRYHWSADEQPGPGQMDVQSVALHEFGHWLGLRDLYGDIGDGEYDVAKVMYGFGFYGKTKRQLHPDDVAGVHFGYRPQAPPDMPGLIEYPQADQDGQYTVRWGASSQASGYQLERSEDGGLDWVLIYQGPHTYLDQTVGPGLYVYRVRAVNAAGPSDWLAAQWYCQVLAPQ